MTIAIIIILLFGGSLTSYRFIQKTTETMGAQLHSLERSLSNARWELAKNELTTVQQDWDKDNIWWSILIKHEEIDTINISLKQLEKYIEAQDLSPSIGEVSSLKLRFEHIYDSEKFTVKNIF
jgi:hypothetical protein